MRSSEPKTPSCTYILVHLSKRSPKLFPPYNKIRFFLSPFAKEWKKSGQLRARLYFLRRSDCIKKYWTPRASAEVQKVGFRISSLFAGQLCLSGQGRVRAWGGFHMHTSIHSFVPSFDPPFFLCCYLCILLNKKWELRENLYLLKIWGFSWTRLQLMYTKLWDWKTTYILLSWKQYSLDIYSGGILWFFFSLEISIRLNNSCGKKVWKVSHGDNYPFMGLNLWNMNMTFLRLHSWKSKLASNSRQMTDKHP